MLPAQWHVVNRFQGMPPCASGPVLHSEQAIGKNICCKRFNSFVCIQYQQFVVKPRNIILSHVWLTVRRGAGVELLQAGDLLLILPRLYLAH